VHGLEERFTTHEGGTLRYLTGGSGPPMLLCHGFIGSAENFDDWLAALVQRRTVVIPDLPGFGKSSSLQGRHTATTLAHAALAALRHARIERFDVAGLCLGACVALAVDRVARDAVDRMVLHTPLLAPWLVRRRFHLQTAVMLAPGVFPGIVWLSRRRIVSDLYKRLMVEGGDVDPAAAQVNFDNQLRADQRAAREWLHDGLRRNDLAQLCGSGRRTMVLVAADDRIVDVRRLCDALRGFDRISVALIEEGGHAWTEAMIRRQRELLAAFLDDQPIPQDVDTAA
jgi:pimeloyl-ACP methyl ester carboxylesterase